MKVFWWRWMVAVTILLLLFSLSFVLLPQVIHNLFEAVFIATGSLAQPVNADALGYIHFVYGVLGAVMVGWMVLLLFTVFGPLRRGERAGWLASASTVLIWFVVDSGWSVVSGFAANALLNSGFLILFLIPLAATYRDFYPSQRS